MEKIDLSKKSLKRFAITLFFILSLWGTFLLWKQKEAYLYFYSIGLVFLLIGLFQPLMLKSLYIIWVKIAYILSWTITHLMLIVVFYLIITPYGLVMRLFGFDPLKIRLEKNKDSYWDPKIKKEFNQKNFEKLF